MTPVVEPRGRDGGRGMGRPALFPLRWTPIVSPEPTFAGAGSIGGEGASR